MKKLAFLLGITLLASTISLQADQSPAYATNYSADTLNWQPDYNRAVALARSSSKPILILFTGTTWCPACMILERSVLTKPEFARAVGDKLVFLKAEFSNYTMDSIQSSPYKFLLDRYQVDSFPTMIAINADGQTLFTVNYHADIAKNPAGAPSIYASEILNKLNQSRTSPGYNSTYYN